MLNPNDSTGSIDPEQPIVDGAIHMGTKHVLDKLRSDTMIEMTLSIILER